MIPALALLGGCGLFLGEEAFLRAVDLDGDGEPGPAFDGADCDDGDRAVFPGAEDAPYDGVDADCAGDDDFDADRDGARVEADCDDGDPAVGADPVDWHVDCDGDGAPGEAVIVACAEPALPLPRDADPCGGAPARFHRSPEPRDCDDLDAGRAPGRRDPPYDGVDADCGGDDDFDADGDGAPAPGAGGAGPFDCDDGDDGVFPGARDAAGDGVDTDCAGDNDFDADGDGFVADPRDAGGTAPAGGDCDDDDAAVHPGAPDAPYDGVDANCGGDDDFDADRDGAPVPADCDDADPARSPLAVELPYDGVDRNCDDADEFDADRDGSPVGEDCDDTSSAVRPGAVDPPYDNLDADCAGDDDFDLDGDGWSWPFDCDDLDPTTSPAASEVWYDGADGDCDGGDDYDADRDGGVPDRFAAVSLLPATDCDDADARRAGHLPEAWYDGVDGDCAGGSDFDADGDGFVAAAYPLEATGGLDPGDCDDADPTVFPGAADLAYDGADGDCAGDNDYDADGDGFVSLAFPEQVGGSAPRGGDCADADAARHPEAADDPYDGVDADCGLDDDFDVDRDGVPLAFDCDDLDPRRAPSAPEVWYDGVDQDCAGGSDYDADGDGVVAAGLDAFAGPGDPTGDCDDAAAATFPGAPDAPYDGADADCDGRNDFDADRDGFVGLAYGAEVGGTAPLSGDCDDGDPARNPIASDPPDGLDRNCDGFDAEEDGDGDASPGCFGVACDCDDGDPDHWVGDLVVTAPADLQTLVDHACPGARLTLVGAFPDPLAIDRALTLSGGTLGRVEVTGGVARLEDLRLTGGTAAEGGCLRVTGEAELDGVTIDGCTATAGGGVWVSGALDVVGSAIVNTLADDGGGIYAAPGAVVAVTGSDLTATAANRDGGGIAGDGARIALAGARFTSTMAGDDGGAIAVLGGSLSVTGVEVVGAVAGHFGSALRAEGSGVAVAGLVTRGTRTDYQSPIGGGGVEQPAVVNLRETGRDADGTVLDDLDLLDDAAGWGVYVGNPAGDADLHDVNVDSLSLVYGLHVDLNSLVGASRVALRNLRIDGPVVGVTVLTWGAEDSVRLENASILAFQTALDAWTTGGGMRVTNVVAALGGLRWTDGYTVQPASELRHVTLGAGGAYEVFPDPPLPVGAIPAICPTCSASPAFPFVNDGTLSTLPALAGTGDPDLCPAGAPATCLDPGYAGGPDTP